jgi:fimbrial chaperone protein
MLKYFVCGLAVTALFSSVSLPVFANLSASPIILTYQDGGKTRQDITLKNSGDRPQYLEITAYRIVTPGQFPEDLTTDPNPKKVGLLVAPRRIALKPGEQKLIRVIRLDNAINEDEAWRVHIKPAKVDIDAKTSGAMLQIGYKALVFARPENAQAKLVGRRKGTVLTVKNTGNSNAVLHEGEQCDAAGKACKKITGKRLWPGQEWETTLPYDTEVTFKILGPNDVENIRY